MKKLIPCSLFLWMLIGHAWGQSCSTTITTYPYLQNFDAGAGGWIAGGTNSSWALGTPAKNVINSAASTPNSWVTNLTGNYNISENSYVQSPCLNFSTLCSLFSRPRSGGNLKPAGTELYYNLLLITA